MDSVVRILPRQSASPVFQRLTCERRSKWQKSVARLQGAGTRVAVAKAPAGDSPAPPFLARGGLAYSWRMPGWSSKLTRPVVIKGGPLLRTLGDVRAFMIDHLPPEDQDRVSWQRTAELLLAAAEGSAEIEACTQQIERTLFLQAKWLLPED
jgi:hypothetical protein